MQTYGSLNLRKLRDDNGLDFAHFTFLRGQCSCCYGPMDLPDRYWVKGRKPVLKKTVSENGGVLETHEPLLSTIQYILFKNAANGSGTVTKNDTICQRNIRDLPAWRRTGHDHTYRVCVAWQFPEEKMDGVLRSLREQLDDDYVVLRPRDRNQCIQIVYKDDVTDTDTPLIYARENPTCK